MREHREPSPRKTELVGVRLGMEDYAALRRFMEERHTTNRSRALRLLIEEASQAETLKRLLREASKRGQERDNLLTAMAVQMLDMQDRLRRLERKEGRAADKGIN